MVGSRKPWTFPDRLLHPDVAKASKRERERETESERGLTNAK